MRPAGAPALGDPRPRIFVARLAVFFLGLLPSAARALPDDLDRWIRVETAHFTLFSDASETRTREVGQRLELFREALARVNPSLTINSPLPTHVYLFKNSHALGPYRKHSFGVALEMDGLFVGSRDGNYVALNATPNGDPYEAVYHEYVHYFTNNNFPHLPAWFEEGFADCYSTFSLEEGRAAIGRPVESHLASLRANRPVPVSELVAVTHDSRDYNENDRRGGFYAGAWALTHYLVWGPRDWKADLPRYLERLGSGESLASILRPITYDKLDQEVAAYLKRGRLTYSLLEVGQLKPDEAARVTPMPPAEVLARLGDHLAHLEGRQEDAAEHFREAIRLDASQALAYLGLAALAAEQGRQEEAARNFERALALQPDDPLIGYRNANAILDRLFGPGIRHGPLTGDEAAAVRRARDLFRRSVRARPDLAEAWAGLGATFTHEDGDLSEGIAALETARAMLPSRMDVAFNLLVLYAGAGDLAKARALYDQVLVRGADARTVRGARDALLQGEIAGAIERVQKGETGEGLKALETILAETRDNATKAYLEDKIREIRRVGDHNRQVDRYNRAIQLAKRKDYAGARALLEQVAREAADPDLAAKAKEMLASLPRPSGRRP